MRSRLAAIRQPSRRRRAGQLRPTPIPRCGSAVSSILDEGLISAEEYEEKRSAILGELYDEEPGGASPVRCARIELLDPAALVVPLLHANPHHVLTCEQCPRRMMSISPRAEEA